MQDWTTEQVRDFMIANGTVESGALLAEQRVDGSVLEDITREELTDDFAVATFGEAKRIQKLIQEARQEIGRASCRERV